MSQFRYILGQTSTNRINMVYIPTPNNIDPGNDILAYDNALGKYVGIKGDTYDPTVPGFTDRYDTNNDIIIGITDDVIHAVASSDAGSEYGDTAACHLFYKLTLPTDVLNGIKSFDMSTGGVTRTFTGSVDTIVAKMKDASTEVDGGFGASGFNTYSNTFFVEKLNESTIGIGRGSYSSNGISITYDESTIGIGGGSTNGLLLEDLSKKAINIDTVKSGDDYDATFTPYQPTVHKDFRAISCTASGYTSPAIPSALGPITSCYCNTKQNYSYRSGVNYKGFKEWAYSNGNDTFYSDGVNDSSANSAGAVMKYSRFVSDVTPSGSDDGKKMYAYYHELYTSQDPDIVAKREDYEAMYGARMTSEYDAYLMSHMIDVNYTGGVTERFRNKGKYLTGIKGIIMVPDYNGKYVPAYPPEYKALQYGKDDVSSHFKKGSYYLPEPYDIGLFMRDDIMAKVNARTLSLYNNYQIPRKALANTNYLGTCAEYHATNTWSFSGYYYVFYSDNRFVARFHARPCFACSNS